MVEKLHFLRANPLIAGGAILAALVLGALLIGLFSGPPAAQKPAVVVPAAAPVTSGSAPTPTPAPAGATAPATAAAAPAPRLMPPALPPTATPTPGARETIANHGREWGGGGMGAQLANLELRDGTPLARLDTAATQARESRGWSEDQVMRVGRSGLFNTTAAGAHSFILELRDDGAWGAGGEGRKCTLALSDPTNVLATVERDGSAVGTAELAAGWHWLYLSCDAKRTHLTADVAITAPGASAPAAVPLALPAAEPTAPAPASAEVAP